jgi:hypothetical protein
MKKLHIAVSVLMIVVICMPVNAQQPSTKLKTVMILRSCPDFTLQFNINYNQAMGQLAGTYNDDFRSDQFINGRSLGADKGLGGDMIGKIKLDNIGHFRLIFSGHFNKVSSYLFKKSGIADVGETKFNIYSAGFGLENNFTPDHRMKLYLGAEALISMINGSATIWVENKPNTPYTYGVNIGNSIRMGGILLGGIEYLVNNSFGLNLGFNITYANMFMKNGENPNSLTDIKLIDDDGNPQFAYSGKKQFVFLTISAGISIYWGVVEKRYIYSRY